MHKFINTIQIIFVIFLSSGCVTTRYYTPPTDTVPHARVRFLAADNIHYAVTMYEDASCTIGFNSGFMGGPGYDLSKVPHSIPQPVKSYGNTLGMSNIPELPPLSFIERRIPAQKELAFVINRGYGHRVTPGIGYTSLSMKTCNMTFAFSPKPGGQYEVDFSVNSDSCNLSIEEFGLDGNRKLIRTPVTTFRDLGQQCSVYTKP